ncbi:MAG: GNAT family N-acetyltransferase [Leptolyngbyaceae cyanobacterium]
MPRLQSSIVASVVDYRAYREDIHSIRQAVFVGEQHVPAWFETDCLDPICRHVLAHWHNWVVGTGRLTPEGSIGRVAVAKPLRRRGVGRKVMATLLKEAQCQGHESVTLAAQCHAIPFYERLGFYCESDPYEHVGIAHVTMRKRLA